MMRKNRYLDGLGIPRQIYCGNFVREKKFFRLFQRCCYGFDYRDIFNMDASFAEWLYSHMLMYKNNSVQDDASNSIIFEEKEYTIEEAVNWIIEKTGAFLKYCYYMDAHFDYITVHPLIGKLMCKLNPAVRLYLEEYDWSEENEYQIEVDYINAGKLFLEIMGFCWM